MQEQQNQFVLALFAYAAQRDVSISTLSEASGIDPHKLMKQKNYPVTRQQVNSLWLHAIRLCQDDFFGLHFGESLQLAALGAVGEIIRNSETVGQALTIAASFTPVVTDLFTMKVKHNAKRIHVTLYAGGNEEHNFIAEQMADFLLVFTIHELDGFLLRKIKPRAVLLPRAKKKSTEYERVLRCKPKTADHYGIHFDAKDWDVPIITGNYELQKFFLEKMNSTSSKDTSAISFQVKVLAFLSKNAYLGIASLEDVAANFNITPRSLQRRLQEESVTFQQIADSVRKSLALQYLESGHQIKEIAHILGYKEISAFSRAFKRWTGKAPIEYRA